MRGGRRGLRLTASLAGAALLALGAPASPAAAQAAKPAPKAAAKPAAAKPVAKPAAPAGPAVGASATYRWTSTLTETVPVLLQQPQSGAWSVAQEKVALPPLLVTYSVVRADARTYTLQIVTHEGPDGTPLSVTQVTVDRASGKAVRSLIRRPKGVVATPDSALRPFREADVSGQREEVTVAAGRFTAVHGPAKGADVWVSNEVPVLGLVKGVWPEGTLELVGSAATGAKDHFKS